MTGLHGRSWYHFVWDDENEFHLGQHGISPEEAEEVFFNRYVVVPNKRKHGPKRFIIDGKADSGRKLRVIFEDLGKHEARVITGWDL